MLRSLCKAAKPVRSTRAMLEAASISPHQRTFLTLCIALLGSATALVGCSRTPPTPYAGLASSSQLQPNLQDRSGRIPHRISKSIYGVRRGAEKLVAQLH